MGDTEVAVGGSCHYLVRRGEEGMHARRTPPAPTARWDRSVQGRQSGQALAIHSFPGRWLVPTVKFKNIIWGFQPTLWCKDLGIWFSISGGLIEVIIAPISSSTSRWTPFKARCSYLSCTAELEHAAFMGSTWWMSVDWLNEWICMLLLGSLVVWVFCLRYCSIGSQQLITNVKHTADLSPVCPKCVQCGLAAQREHMSKMRKSRALWWRRVMIFSLGFGV